MRTRSKRTIACARATAGLEWQQIRLSQPDISMQAQPAIARLRTRSSRYSASALGPAGASASPDDEIPRPHPTCLRPLGIALRAEDVHQYLRRVVGLDGRDHEVEGRGRYGEARALAEGLHPPMRPTAQLRARLASFERGWKSREDPRSCFVWGSFGLAPASFGLLRVCTSGLKLHRLDT